MYLMLKSDLRNHRTFTKWQLLILLTVLRSRADLLVLIMACRLSETVEITNEMNQHDQIPQCLVQRAKKNRDIPAFLFKNTLMLGEPL